MPPSRANHGTMPRPAGGCGPARSLRSVVRAVTVVTRVLGQYPRVESGQ